VSDTITVAEVKRRVAEGIRAAFDDAWPGILADGYEITVERDPDNPERVNCAVPIWPSERIIHAEFYEYDAPVGCRK
jgi:hypothetical protein